MRDKIIKYNIAGAGSLADLSGGINQALQDGWQPIGGVFTYTEITPEGPQTRFGQTMVEYESPILLARK